MQFPHSAQLSFHACPTKPPTHPSNISIAPRSMEKSMPAHIAPTKASLSRSQQTHPTPDHSFSRVLLAKLLLCLTIQAVCSLIIKQSDLLHARDGVTYLEEPPASPDATFPAAAWFLPRFSSLHHNHPTLALSAAWTGFSVAVVFFVRLLPKQVRGQEDSVVPVFLALGTLAGTLAKWYYAGGGSVVEAVLGGVKEYMLISLTTAMAASLVWHAVRH